ncbi:hypothetical protein O982_24455 [Mycobacterium avium 10-5581]|nr:hypothetical protein O982_24455 [Mycobacterium avium 10-5581]
MGMTQLLARYAARRVHVLTVEAPGYWEVRAEAERRLGARGWCAATSPADADVLAVCGMPGPELSEAIDRVWDQMPGPRVRIDLPEPDAVESALHRAFMHLVDIDMQRNDARERPQSPDLSTHHHSADHRGHHQMDHDAMNHGEHGDIDHAMHHETGHHDEHGKHQGMSHDAMEHGQMEHDEHQHMDHGDMDMAPAGIALAVGGDDRDGLEMDMLHVRLGPVLCYWPAGLVLRCSLQGDVLTEAEAWVVDSDGDHGSPVPDGRHGAAARQCDHLVDVLALAGWGRAAGIARTARDALVNEPDHDHAGSLLAILHGKLRRSRVLRWSLRDIASLTAEDCDLLGLSTALAGDCYDRLLARVEMAREMMSNTLEPNAFHVNSTRIVDTLPHLVGGLDLATARLVVASLGVDTAPGRTGARHG